MNGDAFWAVMDIAKLFGIPLLAMAGGIGLRRKYKEERGTPFHAGTVLAAGGTAVLLWIFALIAMMRNW